MMAVNTRVCPLCESHYTHFGDSWSDGEEYIVRPFKQQRCENKECELPCLLWETVIGLQTEIQQLKPLSDFGTLALDTVKKVLTEKNIDAHVNQLGVLAVDAGLIKLLEEQ